MKQVMDAIERRARAQQDHPFIRWIADTSVPLECRVKNWLPSAAFFVMGFRDLHDLLLRYPEEEAHSDEMKAAINRHVEEEVSHWHWFLEDLRCLKLDRVQPLTDSLRLLWSPETREQRLAIYRLAQLLVEASDAELRYCAIRAIEACGHSIFNHASTAGTEYAEREGLVLAYLGRRHLQKETGSLQRQTDGFEHAVMERDLGMRRELGLHVIERVFDVIESRWYELHRVATTADSTVVD